MDRQMKRRWLFPVLLSGLLTLPALQADEDDRSGYYGMGPGMMGGSGMMGRGYGPEAGDDDGWRTPCGPGMMGGYGMGMMGPGMMMNRGMMGGVWGLNLSDKQRQRIRNLMNEQHQRHWPQMTALSEQYGRLRQLYAADKPDAEAIGKAYDDIFQQRREMIVSHIKLQNRIRDELTDEQRRQLDAMRRGGWR